jgi:branched-chain amino acid transport system substrate-binding protein
MPLPCGAPDGAPPNTNKTAPAPECPRARFTFHPVQEDFMLQRKLVPVLLAALALSAGAAQADINVGVTLSATGPAASLGIPEKNTFELMPATIGGEKVNYIILDDGSDTTKAVTNTRKLLSENKVDVIVGSTITPNSLAMADVVADAETPMISMAASARIVDPASPKTKWVFKTPQSDSLMADAIAVHMKANGVKTLGYIGFADAYGDGWLAEMKRSAQTAGIKVVAEEKYNRNDASVNVTSTR